MKQFSGFTLVELLVGVVLFTLIIGSLFSVIAALRQAEVFRDENAVVTQGASFAYEPVIRSLKAADAMEGIMVNGVCQTVRGYYGLDSGNQALLDLNLDLADVNVTNQKLATVDAETIFDAEIGSKQQWVRRVYALAEQSKNGRIYTTLTETVYHASPAFSWPQSLRSCAPDHWEQVGEPKELTGDAVTVSHFLIRMIAPIVGSGGERITNAPFATIGVTVANPLSRTAPPLTLQSTISPTFTYGEQRD